MDQNQVLNKKEKIAADFREEIKHAFEPDGKVMSADRELRYCLEKQRDRMNKRNLTCVDEMIHRGSFPNGLNRVRSWKDEHYDTSWTVDYINHKKTFKREGMRTYKFRQKQSIYETVVDVRNGVDVSEDTYCCPNCGWISKIRELEEGCSHCNTSFKMSELYPKISNYYFVYDITGKTDNFFLTILKYGLILYPISLIVIFIILAYQKNLSFADFLLNPQMIIVGLIVSVIMIPAFGFAGFMYSVFWDFFRLACRDLPILFAVITARSKFASRMSKLCPEFTFEYFTSRMVSLFKILVFSDNREELPFYSGRDLGNELDNIVDVSFLGSMSCRSVKEKDNMVYVTADIFVDNARDLGRKIKVKNDIYRIKAGRRLDIPFSTNFSISKIHCRTCGGSFDAFKSNICPYCGNKYEPETNDWVIYDVRNVGFQTAVFRIITEIAVIAVVALSFLVLFLEMTGRITI